MKGEGGQTTTLGSFSNLQERLGLPFSFVGQRPSCVVVGKGEEEAVMN